jgi:heme exporter protein A
MTARFSGTDLVCLRGEKLLFTGLDFTLASGEVLLLLGPNGSGKSSLLRLMAGLLPPLSGRLAWDDRPVARDREAHCARLGYLGHLDAIKPGLTVREHLAWHASLGDASRAPAALDAALAALGITPLAEVPGRQLSAGQRRRVALARFLLRPASLWLLDEPTVGLDEDGVARFRSLIDRHCRGGGMAVIATHIALGIDENRMHVLRPGDFAPEQDA